MPRTPDEVDRFRYERSLLAQDLYPFAGIDEAGRGPLAGPVTAAAAVLPEAWIEGGLPDELKGLNDSKKLTEKKRERLYAAIRALPGIDCAVANIDAAEIDRINILEATHVAMNTALAGLKETPRHALVDGRPVKTLTVSQTAIVKGDSLSFSIAAASILAKVSRDRLMLKYDREYPAYGFAAHKGYGTKQHLAAIAKHGPSPIHRLSFAPLKPPPI